MLLPSCRTLDGFALRSTERSGLTITDLEPGVTLIVKTRYSSYRLVILDAARRLVMVDGGVFPEATVVTLSGATFGGSALKVGWIVEGLRLEFATACDGSRPRLSSVSKSKAPRQSMRAIDVWRNRVAVTSAF